ncbi:hypothetical protein PEC301879_24360 [Pectobacterium carotovorum subsp. carotovorum]|nr:hypothetical protein PEC301879_24360 [Pectobacterium carotovorum subsp. carotovorum]
MKIFIIDEQKTEFEYLHDTRRDKPVCDRIKAVLLASEDWSSIAQAFCLHETTVNHHINGFVNQRKLNLKAAGDEPLRFIDVVHPSLCREFTALQSESERNSVFMESDERTCAE